MVGKRALDQLSNLEGILKKQGKKTANQLVSLANSSYLSITNIYKVLVTSDEIIVLPKKVKSDLNEYAHLTTYSLAELKIMYPMLSDKDKMRVNNYLQQISGEE